MSPFSSAAGVLAAAVGLLGTVPVDGRLAPDIAPFGEMAAEDFKPLTCNGAMNDGVFDNCQGWSTKGYDPSSGTVTIPCGECVDMDLAEGTDLVFAQGLDVVGALRFPLNWKGTLRAPFFYVQGHLIIENDAEINAANIDGLQFILEGTYMQDFFPHPENKDSCRGSSCDVGKKPFVVAGGKVDVRAIPDTCPTWVPLLDVIRNDAAVTATDYPAPTAPLAGCTNDIILHNFDNGSGYGPFKNGLGSEESINVGGSHDGSNSFLVVNREKKWQGPFVDFASTGLGSCVQSNTTYLIQAKAKIYVENPSTNATYSNCHTTGADCLALTLHKSTENLAAGKPDVEWKTLGQVKPSAKADDNTWFDFTAEVEFTDADLADDVLYLMMYFGGPESGVAVEIDDVHMWLPTQIMYPDPAAPGGVCADLVINGDAENKPPHYFPWGFMGNREASVRVLSETVNGTENNYFAIRGRNATWTSINVELINDCIVRHSQYTIKARLRLHSADQQDVRMIVKTWPVDPPPIPPFYSTKSVGFGGISSCVGLNAEVGWFECERQFQFKEEHETATKIELSFVVPDDATSDLDIDDVQVIRYAPPLNEFVVDSSVVGCWGQNATILQTSHTLSHKDENILEIESVTDRGDGTAVVKSYTPVAKPSTAADDPNYAVELALLSRNVKIAPVEPNDDIMNPTHGPHFMIAHTPNVTQVWKGVHHHKMGQQTNFGRYPLHLHMNKNITGSDVSRNLVTQSDQRCYVVHGTHGVHLEYNIAHDTFGHCFMLEDGVEQNNTFNYNLGSMTKEIPDDNILSIAESDNLCATFWMSNPRNFFEGNVAAGSEDTGFWYEFLELVRGPSVRLDPYFEINPSSFLFGHFRNNVFHSNKGEGFKLYPNGYFPDTRAIFEGSRAIKNKGDGVLLHNSRNLGIDGGVYADNRMQIEVDKQADDVTVTNALVIGFSDLYKFESEAGGLASHCPAHRPISGVQLHSFLRFRDSKGYHLENITFVNFEEGGFCVGTTAIEMDKQLRDGHFDAFTTVKNLNFAEGAPMKEKFNMCALAAQEYFIGDLAINDLDGSLHPDELAPVPGFVVSNSTKMTTFIPPGDECLDMDGSCALFCENACYRTLNFAVPVAFEYEDLVMEVKDDNTGLVAEFPGYFENKTKTVQNVDVEDVYENFVYARRRYYSPIVPAGQYTLRFKKEGSDADYWPMMVETVWEDEPNCTGYIDENTTNFVIPATTAQDCANLVRNPGGEDGSYNHWMHSGGGIKLYTAGSASTGSYAISSDGRTGAWQGPGQFLDTRCMKTVGAQYEITAKFKLTDSNGNEKDCDPNQKNMNHFAVCPRVSFRMRQMLGNRIGDAVEVGYAYPMAETVAPFKTGEWNNIYGVFTVTETMANADAIFMFVERAPPGTEIVIDDMLIQPTVQSCSNPIYNGDFESGDTRFWSTIGQSKIDIMPGGFGNSAYALKTTERQQFWSSMSHEINLDCIQEGEQYTVTGMLMLLDDQDNPMDCDPEKTWGLHGMDGICPTLAMRVVTGNLTVDTDLGTVTGGWTPGTWNDFYGLITVDADLKKADTVTLYFTRYMAGRNLAIDDLKMTPMTAQDPDQLVNNGNATSGDARFFVIKDGGTLDVTQPGYDDDYAFIVTNRVSSTYGMGQPIAVDFLEDGVVYKIHAMVKLLLPTGVAFDCDPAANYGEKVCPKISVRAKNAGEPPSTRAVASIQGDWLSGGWNRLEGHVTFLRNEVAADSLFYFIDGPKAGADLLLDNVGLTKTDLVAVA